MKTAVIGSRTFIDYEKLVSCLEKIHDISEIITGGAKGADTLAEKYAKQKGLKLNIFKPDYARHGKLAAPLMRNYLIIDNSDLIVVFWDGKSKGTKHAISYARKKRKEVKIVFYNNLQ